MVFVQFGDWLFVHLSVCLSGEPAEHRAGGREEGSHQAAKTARTRGVGALSHGFRRQSPFCAACVVAKGPPNCLTEF